MTTQKIAMIAIIVISAMAGYFFYQNQKLSAELNVFKNTDQVKEAAALKLKLILYVNVLKAFDDWQRPANAHLLDRDTSKIDSAISILGDTEVLDLWQEVKANFPQGKLNGDFRDNEVPVLVTSKLVRLLK